MNGNIYDINHKRLTRNIFVIMTLIAAAFIATSCAKKNVGLPDKLRIASGGTSGNYYAYASVLGEMIQKQADVPANGIPVTVRATGGSVENVRLVQAGKVDFAFVQNDIMTYAYNGTGLFSTEDAQKDFSAVAGLYPETCQIVAIRSIESIADLQGKRVSVGDQGSGTELNALQILESYGISESGIDAQHLGFGASVVALEAGRIDAFFCTAGIPTPALSAVAASGRVRLLGISDARARNLVNAYPFYAPQTIPAGTYPGIAEDVTTVAVQATLVAHNAVSDAAVRLVLKTLFEQGAAFGAIVTGAHLDRATATMGITIPLHPGAAAWFREN
jgi:TRAP transporter TAXI family solute receptor